MDLANLLQEEQIQADLMSVWGDIIAQLCNEHKLEGISDRLIWAKDVLERNIQFGKLNRGVAAVYVYRRLAKERSAEDDHLSYVLGWCLEILHTSYCMTVDLIDGSNARTGRPCWYMEETDDCQAGLRRALVDIRILIYSVKHILMNFFEDKPYGTELIHFFTKISLTTAIGKTLDYKMGANLEAFTMKAYRQIVAYKKSSYSFFAPVRTAMIMTGANEKGLDESSKTLLHELGYLYEVQTDFLNCFGDPALTGFVGDDIIRGKCTWLICKAMELASTDQKESLQNLYGSQMQDDEDAVKQIYLNLNLKSAYREEETALYTRIQSLIQDLPCNILKGSLTSIADVIYRRNK